MNIWQNRQFLHDSVLGFLWGQKNRWEKTETRVYFWSLQPVTHQSCHRTIDSAPSKKNQQTPIYSTQGEALLNSLKMSLKRKRDSLDDHLNGSYNEKEGPDFYSTFKNKGDNLSKMRRRKKRRHSVDGTPESFDLSAASIATKNGGLILSGNTKDLFEKDLSISTPIFKEDQEPLSLSPLTTTSSSKNASSTGTGYSIGGNRRRIFKPITITNQGNTSFKTLSEPESALLTPKNMIPSLKETKILKPKNLRIEIPKKHHELTEESIDSTKASNFQEEHEKLIAQQLLLLEKGTQENAMKPSKPSKSTIPTHTQEGSSSDFKKVERLSRFGEFEDYQIRETPDKVSVILKKGLDLPQFPLDQIKTRRRLFNYCSFSDVEL